MSQLRQMEVFVAVVDCGSFSRAAEQLGMSAVMVGRHIQSLEHAVNAQLIQRTTRRQAVTAEGRLFYEEARLALDQVQLAYSRIEAASAAPSGLLRISAPMTLGASLVAPLVAEFMVRFTHIQVELILSNEVVDLYERTFDLAFRVSDLVEVNLVSQALRPYQMVICAAPAYLDTHGTPQQPDDLYRHRLLTHTSWNNRFAWPLVDAGGEFPWPERAVMRSNDGQVLLHAALAGVGVLMQPDFLVREALETGQLRAIMPACVPPPKPVHLVYPRAKKTVPKIKAFVAFVEERLATC
ncbi:LysR substrate-binding domain-containing protein [Pseudomonas sp. SDO528_S397]